MCVHAYVCLSACSCMVSALTTKISLPVATLSTSVIKDDSMYADLDVEPSLEGVSDYNKSAAMDSARVLQWAAIAGVIVRRVQAYMR